MKPLSCFAMCWDLLAFVLSLMICLNAEFPNGFVELFSVWTCVWTFVTVLICSIIECCHSADAAESYALFGIWSVFIVDTLCFTNVFLVENPNVTIVYMLRVTYLAVVVSVICSTLSKISNHRHISDGNQQLTVLATDSRDHQNNQHEHYQHISEQYYPILPPQQSSTRQPILLIQSSGNSLV